jgi:hypothetical protein
LAVLRHELRRVLEGLLVFAAGDLTPGADDPEQWQEAAEAWHRWELALEAWLGEATDLMLDMSRIGTSDRVFDVAGGSGSKAGSSPPTSRRSSSRMPREALRAGLVNVARRPWTARSWRSTRATTTP